MNGWGRVTAWGSVGAFEDKLDCCGGPKGISSVNVWGAGGNNSFYAI